MGVGARAWEWAFAWAFAFDARYKAFMPGVMVMAPELRHICTIDVSLRHLAAREPRYRDSKYPGRDEVPA